MQYQSDRHSSKKRFPNRRNSPIFPANPSFDRQNAQLIEVSLPPHIYRKKDHIKNSFAAKTKRRLMLTANILKKTGLVDTTKPLVHRAIDKALRRLDPERQETLLGEILDLVESKLPAYLTDLKSTGVYPFLRSGFREGLPIPFCFQPSGVDMTRQDGSTISAAMSYQFHKQVLIAHIQQPSPHDLIKELAVYGTLNEFVSSTQHELVHWEQDKKDAFVLNRLSNYTRRALALLADALPPAAVATATGSTILGLVSFLYLNRVSGWFKNLMHKFDLTHPRKGMDMALITELQAYTANTFSHSAPESGQGSKQKVIDMISSAYGRAAPIGVYIMTEKDPTKKEAAVKKQAQYQAEAKIILERAYDLMRALRLLGYGEDNITNLVVATNIDSDGICDVLSSAVDNARICLNLQNDAIFQSTMEDLESIHRLEGQILRSEVQQLVLNKLRVDYRKIKVN